VSGSEEFGNEKGKNLVSPVVVLPCEPDHFRDFISGLLGRPQTLRRHLRGPFDVKREDAEGLFHLINQRVNSQNEATLIQFTARIVYDDNSSVLLNSFGEFQIYNEVKPLISVALHLSWTFLIKFQNSPFPEKQQIEVGFVGSDEAAAWRVRAGRIIFDGAEYGGPGAITIQISHTNRSWGADIEALLAGHLALLQRTIPRVRMLAAKYSSWIGFLSGFAIFASTLATGVRVTNRFLDQYLLELARLPLSSAPDLDLISKKLDFLTQIVGSGMWSRYGLYTGV
jgi:hypothetical protein